MLPAENRQIGVRLWGFIRWTVRGTPGRAHTQMTQSNSLTKQFSQTMFAAKLPIVNLHIYVTVGHQSNLVSGDTKLVETGKGIERNVPYNVSPMKCTPFPISPTDQTKGLHNVLKSTKSPFPGCTQWGIA